MSNVILHLSDLHFGAEKKDDPTSSNRRTVALKSLVEFVRRQDADWRPTIVVVSGDIGYAGKDSDYEQASEWLKQLLEALNLSAADIVVCPGNHDVDRKAVRAVAYPPSPNEADDWLSPPIDEHLQKRFSAFSRFCSELGMLPNESETERGFLYGTKVVRGLRFVILNSAWFSQGASDKGNLWIGLPHLQALAAQGIVSLGKQPGDAPCIALVHHPRDWYAEAEHSPYANILRQNTFDYLALRCDLIMTGHTHSGIRHPDRVGGRAWHVTAGAAYDNASHFNNVALIKVEDSGFILRAFEFDPRASGQPWEPKGEAKILPFVDVPPSGGPFASNRSQSSHETSLLKLRAVQHAQREIEKKSRAIQRDGILPSLSTRDVTVYSLQEHYVLGTEGMIQPSHREVRMDIRTAVDRSSKTLLLAELGAGKSTLASQLVMQLVEKDGLIAVLVPAGKLKGSSFETVSDLSESISAFISRHLVPEWFDFSLFELLRQRSEITLVVDGLDELPHTQGKRLLERLADLVHQWANVRVFATGRPVELSGFNYSEWQIISFPEFTEADRLEIFREMALAGGMSEPEAYEQSESRLQTLRRRGDLEVVATTPLVLRLLYPHLAAEGERSDLTLGDLLFNLLEERVGGWSEKDGRDKVDHRFEAAFPTTASRVRLLGALANYIHLSKDSKISRTGLELSLEEAFADGVERTALASETVQYFLRHILVEEDGVISFPVQPLYECALAVHHFEIVSNGEKVDLGVTHKDWRAVSFTAAFARRVNRLPVIQHWLTDYMRKLISLEDNIPAAAIVVAESDSGDLALSMLEGVRNLGFRPLKIFSDDGGYSVQCLAKTLRLGGEQAWVWFFDQYLDPTVPAPDHVLGFAGDILTAWMVQQGDSVPESCRRDLLSLVPPHLCIGHYRGNAILAPIALLIPEAFDPVTRSELYTTLIWLGPLQEQARAALLHEGGSGQREAVLKALAKAIRQGYEPSGLSAALWMKVNPIKYPPVEILRGVLKGGYGKKAHPIVKTCWDSWAASVDPKRVLGLLRAWLSSPDGELACTAACVLYDHGVRNWRMLLRALLRGLHDGGRVQKGEETLRSMIDTGGSSAFAWLVEQFDPEGSMFSLPHSASWRVLLRGLLNQEEAKPEWLCRAVAAMDDYVLARNPEIRQALSDLLKGRHSEAYVSALREQLFNVVPVIRKRTACVLVTIFPDSESIALKIAVHSSFDPGVANWEAFGQRLRLGPSMLSYLRESWPEWTGHAQVFALLLLYRNGVVLNDSEWNTLVSGLLSTWRFIDRADTSDSRQHHNPVLADPRALQHLIKTLESNQREAAARAASSLLTYHHKHLSVNQKARADLLTVSFGTRVFGLTATWTSAIANEEYRAAILAEGQRLLVDGQEEPPLLLLARAYYQPELWKRILWHALCAGLLSRIDAEALAEWFYEVGIIEPEAKPYLGEAASEYLQDPRLQDRFSVHAREVLGLIGHFYGTVSGDELKLLVLASDRQLCGPLEVCMVARIGYPLEGYHAQKEDLTPAPTRERDPDVVDEEIRKILLPSEEVHPDFWNYLEDALLLFNDSDSSRLNPYTHSGYWGGWFSLLLSFYREGTVDVALLAALTKSWRFRETQRQENPYSRLIEMRRQVYWHVKDNEEVRTGFIHALRNLRALNWADESTRVFLLLQFGAKVSEEEVSSILDRMASYEFGFGYEDFLQAFLDWLLTYGVEYRTTIIAGIRRGLTSLANREPLAGGAGLVRLTFPSVLWMMGETPDDESASIWILGLDEIMMPREPRKVNIHDVYHVLEPVWERIPISALRSAVKRAMSSNLPKVRMFARLLAAIARWEGEPPVPQCPHCLPDRHEG